MRMRPRLRPRLLPAVIFFAALTVSLKIGAVWSEIDLAVGRPSVAETEAKPDAPPAPGKAASAPDRSKPAAPGAAAAEPSPAGDGGFDPSRATEAELETLQKLSERRNTLDARERELELRENLLKATESRIDAKIGEMTAVKTTIDALLKKHDKEQEQKMQSLVKIYESMKPKDAARIFERLEMDILLEVVERMREQKTAAVIAEMDPAKAEALTTTLAKRRVLPAAVAEQPKP